MLRMCTNMIMKSVRAILMNNFNPRNKEVVMKYLVSIIFILFMATNVQAKLHTETVEYKEGDTVLEGYLAYDDAIKGKRPGVMVVHEWTGLGPYVKKRATELAELGYIAFAADIYGKGVRPKDHEEAAKVSGIYFKDRSLMRARAKAGLEVLKNHELTDKSHLAAIGYCCAPGSCTCLSK